MKLRTTHSSKYEEWVHGGRWALQWSRNRELPVHLSCQKDSYKHITLWTGYHASPFTTLTTSQVLVVDYKWTFGGSEMFNVLAKTVSKWKGVRIQIQAYLLT